MTRPHERPAEGEAPAARRGPARRRALAAILVLLALAACGVFALSRTLALRVEAARAEMRTRIETLMGFPVAIDGRSALTVLPRARLELGDVRIGPDPARPVLTVEAVRADLDLWQALLGRTEVERLVLVRPELRAGSLPPLPREALARGLDALMRGFAELGRVELRDGLIALPHRRGDTALSNANLALSWRGSDGPMRLAGAYVWNGEPAEIDVALGAPVAFLEGGASTVEGSLDAPALRLGFSGEGSLDAPARFQGRLSAATPSLSRAARWLGDPRQPVPELGSLSVEADLSAIGPRLALRNAAVTLGRSNGQGALEMQVPAGGRPVIGGTLAFEQLDVASLARALAPVPANPLAFVRPLQTGVLDDIDLDLRLSASAASIGETPVTDIAATLKLKGGTASLDIGDATLLGGRAQARATLAPKDGRPFLDGSGTLTGADAQGLAGLLGIDALALTGRADLTLSLASPLRRYADLTEGSRSKMSLLLRDGTLEGLDPRPFVTPGEWPLGPALGAAAIAFERLSAKLHGEGARMSVDELALETVAGRVHASGMLALDTCALALSGGFEPGSALAAAGPPDAFTSAKPSWFRIDGAWPALSVATTGPPAPQP